ncbi:MAG: acetyl-CoA carboxylase biotin carboxyl carrier protein [Qingshengfaniella sp.]
MKETPHSEDVEFIRALAELLRQNDLSELQVKRDYGEDSTLNVRLSRYAQPRHVPDAPVALPAPVAAQPDSMIAAPAPKAVDDPASHPGAVASPMVGTVYLQSEPGADPFISVGATVKEGQTLLIVEAMKTMNQIPSPRAGTVTRILVDDGTPVEYGAPLVIIE